jgi:hypothetical protein
LLTVLLANPAVGQQPPPLPPTGNPLPSPSPQQQQFLQFAAQQPQPAFSQQATLTINGNVAGAAINQLDPCRYFENVSDVQQLNHHEYVAFEQCLYYFLANRAQHQAANAFGAIHPIATLPPAYGGNKGGAGNSGGGPQQKEIRVRVGQITLQHFQLVSEEWVGKCDC